MEDGKKNTQEDRYTDIESSTDEQTNRRMDVQTYL
jgi:hypothetical protein